MIFESTTFWKLQESYFESYFISIFLKSFKTENFFRYLHNSYYHFLFSWFSLKKVFYHIYQVSLSLILSLHSICRKLTTMCVFFQCIVAGIFLISLSSALPKATFVSAFAKKHQLSNVILHVSNDSLKSDCKKW